MGGLDTKKLNHPNSLINNKLFQSGLDGLEKQGKIFFKKDTKLPTTYKSNS